MIVHVNGDSIELQPGTSVRDLIEQLALRGPVAVELNKTIVPRAKHPQQTLHEGDTLEIVTLVGGG